MPESIQERMARFANMKGSPKPAPEPKRVFTMPVEVEPPKGKGYLDRLFDEVDAKHRNRK